MPLYLVNIGNTHTQIAVIQDGEPLLLARYDTPKLIDDGGSVPFFDGTSEPWRAVASSVVPRLKEKMAARYGEKIHFLTAQDFPQLDFSLIDIRTVGMDRIANAAAALRLMDDGPAIVLDCGTCLVTEAVDSQHRFRGGAIMPGRMLMRRGLATIPPSCRSFPSSIGGRPPWEPIRMTPFWQESISEPSAASVKSSPKRAKCSTRWNARCSRRAETLRSFWKTSPN